MCIIRTPIFYQYHSAPVTQVFKFLNIWILAKLSIISRKITLDILLYIVIPYNIMQSLCSFLHSYLAGMALAWFSI